MSHKGVKMTQDAQNLVWVDMEMTGLDPEQEKVLEIAMIVTDKELNVLAEGPVIAIHQSDEVLAGMDEWCTRTHTGSGLVARVRASQYDEAAATAQCLAFLRQWVPERGSPLCGNSIGQDRRFMVRHMPQLEAFFHYRNVDVSTLKELARRWKPDAYSSFKKAQKHTALADVHESIEELVHYRKHFLAVPGHE